MSARRKRVVLKDDPYNQPEEPLMEFRLTYEGLLCASQRDVNKGQFDKRAEHKHDIRKVFHSQLKRLWETHPALNQGETEEQGIGYLSKKHAQFGFNFVPLVTRELSCMCGLEILFLRPDAPGSVLSSGDIDNRLKTLFDSLRVPMPEERYDQRIPMGDECPFFCLLEDDSLITKVSVETDQLLQYVTPGGNANDTRLVITVRFRPYVTDICNSQYS